ncbi:hypothetical protein BU204_29075 [Actinophytocola xanthii]|uniref:Uncharacterized protein n=1 Tax=Actinophytocola xanthii TaxID=1912961 RepID=A0A1Q8CDV1_9PSEU|nr:hypothetical protein BU204_29075 [Actinophytocola xanthii]
MSAEDWTPLAEEYIYLLDVQTDATRAPPAHDDQSLSTEPRLLWVHVVVIVVALFLRWLCKAIAGQRPSWVRRAKTAAALRTWRIRTDARLNQLADAVTRLNVDVDTAKRYVLVLQAFEEARSQQDATEVDNRILELEQGADLPTINAEPPKTASHWRPSLRRRR